FDEFRLRAGRNFAWRCVSFALIFHRAWDPKNYGGPASWKSTVGRVGRMLQMRRRDFIKASVGGPLSASLAWPKRLRAQASVAMRRVGVLMARPEGDPEGTRHASAFERALQDLGWSRGRNLETDFRFWSNDAAQRLTFIRELVALKPDVMLVNSSSYLGAAKPEVGSIPVVFVAVTDPVVQGFVQSLAHPGGSITGFGAEEPSMGSKWMELLKEVAPDTKSVSAV